MTTPTNPGTIRLTLAKLFPTSWEFRAGQRRDRRGVGQKPATWGLSATINSIHKAATRGGRSRKSRQSAIGTASGFRSHAIVRSRTDDPYLILL
jgi:hypothetical protein